LLCNARGRPVTARARACWESGARAATSLRTPINGARVLSVEHNNVTTSSGRVVEVHVRERLPTATEIDDLDIVLAAAVGHGFYD
jgi:hypothetical protein